MKLKFMVDGQKLSRQGECFVASDSRNYLSAGFSFSHEWSAMEKTAIFKSSDEAYSVMLDNDECKVPFEVSGADFTVSVFGVDGDVRITTDYLVVPVEESGYIEGETPAEPTATVYEELLAKIATTKETATLAKDAIAGKADVAALELKADKEELAAHTQNALNPHAVTKEQIGLGSVDNTADKDKPISDAVAAALLQKASVSDIESIRTEATTALQTAMTTSGAHEQLNQNFVTYTTNNDVNIETINAKIGNVVALSTPTQKIIVDAVNYLFDNKVDTSYFHDLLTNMDIKVSYKAEKSYVDTAINELVADIESLPDKNYVDMAISTAIGEALEGDY